MSSIDHVEVLRRRSHLFRSYAQEALQRRHFDLTVFYAEQALQLRLKSLALRPLGYVPRIYSVRELLGLLSKILGSIGRGGLTELLYKFTEAHRDGLESLDEAYVASRYLPRTYEPEDATRALAVVNEAFKLLDKVKEDVFAS
ncbi:MAG: HEPN domain-containing protein [Candidatus Nezhaarchaeota archaeon]|nr:HEPN domain-containing protein [Candidatus Nezhaarchaeota archaeon]